MAIGIGNSMIFKRGGGTSWSTYWSSLISATVENAAPTDVVLTFPTAKTELVDTDFTVTVNGSSVTVNSASWAGAVLTLVIDDTIIYGDAIIVTFVITGDTTNVTNNVDADADADAFITATGITDDTEKAAVNELVIDLKAINATQANFVNFDTPASSVLRAVYPLVGGTATSQKWNLIDPQDADGSFRIVWLNDHEANHTANGYKPNGTDQYGDTKLIPNTHLSVNNTHLAIYPTENIDELGYDIGCSAGGNTFVLVTRFGDVFYNIGYTGATTLNSSSYNSIGFFIGSKIAANDLSSYFNGGKINKSLAAVGSLPTNSITIGKMNGAADMSTKNYGFSSIGAGITEAAASLYYDAVQKFMLALGRVTVPSKIRAGIAFTTDDFQNNTLNYITENHIGIVKAYGYKWTAWMEQTSYSAGDIVNGNILLASDCEFGTHATVVVYRQTHTPAETWTNVIAPNHNAIVSSFGVTPITFANHSDTCVWDVDLLNYLIGSQGYVNVREYEPGHSNFYDGSSQLMSCYNYNNLESTWVAMKALIDDAYANDKILVIMTHHWDTSIDAYHTDYALIQQAVAYVNSLNMSFYKVSELISSLFA